MPQAQPWVHPKRCAFGSAAPCSSPHTKQVVPHNFLQAAVHKLTSKQVKTLQASDKTHGQAATLQACVGVCVCVSLVMMMPMPWVSYCGRPARPNICMTSRGLSSCQLPLAGLYTWVPLMMTVWAGRLTPQARVAVDTSTCTTAQPRYTHVALSYGGCVWPALCNAANATTAWTQASTWVSPRRQETSLSACSSPGCVMGSPRLLSKHCGQGGCIP